MNSFGGRLAFQGELRAVFVVLSFPASDLSTELPFVLERPSPVELLGIGFVAAFHFAVYLWASRWDVAVGDFEIRKMPSELRSERRVVSRYVCKKYRRPRREN